MFSPPFCYQNGVVTIRLYNDFIHLSRRIDKTKYRDTEIFLKYIHPIH